MTTLIEGSFAEEIGLMDRDIIVSINRQAVNNPEDVRRIQGSLKPGDAVAFRVLRQPAQLSLPGQRKSMEKVPYQSLYVAGTLPAN